MKHFSPLFFLLAVAFCTACRAQRVVDPPGAPTVAPEGFNPRKASARAIRCSAGDVKVWGYDNDGGAPTWSAECGNREYRCRRNNSRTMCVATANGKQASNAAEQDGRRVTVRSLHEPGVSPPRAVGIFSFDDSPEGAQERCEESALTWTAGEEGDESASCSDLNDPPKKLTHLTFCDSRLCRIEERTVPSSTAGRVWLSALKKQEKKLEATYGLPNREERLLPDECRLALHSCVTEGAAAIRYLWLWENGSRLELSLDAPSGEPTVSVIYRTTRREVLPSSHLLRHPRTDAHLEGEYPAILPSGGFLALKWARELW